MFLFSRISQSRIIRKFLEIQSRQIKRFFDRSDVYYLLANYSGVFLNIISGILIARQIGSAARGELAFVGGFITLGNYICAMNLSSGISTTLRLPKIHEDSSGNRIDKKFTKKKFFLAPITLSFVSLIILVLCSRGSIQNQVSITFIILFFSFLPSILSSFIALVEGLMRVEGDTTFFSILRFLGLAIPSSFFLILIIINRTTLSYLIFANAITLIIIALYSIRKVAFYKFHNPVRMQSLFANSLKGFMYNSINFIIPLITNIMILNLSGSESLGNFAIAFSFYSLSESLFPNLEAKSHTFLGLKDIKKRAQQRKLLLVNLKKIFFLKILFIPLSFTIPLIYGDQFRTTVFFAIFLLLIGIPLNFVKYVSIICISRSHNMVPTLGEFIYLASIILFWLINFELDNFMAWMVPIFFATIFTSIYTYFFAYRKYL